MWFSVLHFFILYAFIISPLNTRSHHQASCSMWSVKDTSTTHPNFFLPAQMWLLWYDNVLLWARGRASRGDGNIETIPSKKGAYVFKSVKTYETLSIQNHHCTLIMSKTLYCLMYFMHIWPKDAHIAYFDLRPNASNWMSREGNNVFSD